jgi:lipopolysaccharide heptosyltransferase II
MPNTRTFKKILVIRTDRLGDVILSTPVLTALKRAYPRARVDMMVRSYTREVVEDHPHIDTVVIDPEENGSSFFRLVAFLHRQRYDVVLVLHPTFRLALMCWLARIPLRVGTAYRAYSCLFNRRVRQHRRGSGRHEADLNLELARKIGGYCKDLELLLQVSEDTRARVREILQEAGIKDRFVVLHPGSGGSARDWPWPAFADLCDRIQSRLGFKVVLTGSDSERELIDRIAGRCHHRPVRLDGYLSIKELSGVLQQASVVVANSTGPLHLAVAVNTSVVGLYCTLPACHPDRWGPWHHPESVVVPETVNCETDPACMESISVDRVFDKICEQLEES